MAQASCLIKRQLRRHKRFLFPLCALASFVGAAAVPAGESPIALATLCAESDGIVSGVVRQTRSYWDNETVGGRTLPMIFTDVTIEINDRLKGAGAGDTTTLKIRGGCAEGDCIVSPDIPTFLEGNRVVLFTRDETTDAAKICPIVGWRRGAFYTTLDQAGREIVTTSATGGATHRPVPTISYHDDDTARDVVRLEQLVSAGNSETTSEPLTRSRFLELIRDEIARQQTESSPSGSDPEHGHD